ncbi:MAG: stage III sporulation protein AF, partial [Defluviitaleaceae bacterium]|nr:stage III sporulation protein AF [Defluviitaleaceae bacterium]
DTDDVPQIYAGYPFIRVERVDVSLRESRLRQSNQAAIAESTDESIQLLKQTISDFYNIDSDNIHIEVLMRNR